MALPTVISSAVELFDILGYVVFHSALIIYHIGITSAKFVVFLTVSCLEYTAGFLWLLGLVLCQYLPYAFDAVYILSIYAYEALIYASNIWIDFVLSVWWHPGLVDLRDMIIVGLQSGVLGIVEAVVTQPLFCGRIVLISISIVLFAFYRSDILRWIRRSQTKFSGRVSRTRVEVQSRVRWGIELLLHPFRCLSRLPFSVSGAAGHFKESLKRSGPSIPLIRSHAHAPSDEADVTRLIADVRKLQKCLEDEREAKLCVICLTNVRQIVCLPCGHFATCEECTALLPTNILSRKVCPVCRASIKDRLKVYL